MKWDDYFLQLAEVVKLKSKDQSTKIGAIIVGQNNEIVSTGYNSFPRGIDDGVPERQERPEKYYWFEHAERNSIFNAARIGVSTLGCKMYMSCGIPCADCARGIINAGIVEIWCKGDNVSETNPDKWNEHAKRSLQMFSEAGVTVNYY
jgi:dCMP deaminase